MEKQIGTFAAGCFWYVEERFMKFKGVLSTRVGYTGGHVQNPTYEMVCSKTTGHAEGVEVLFDPSVVTYKELVEFFFSIHDPTTLNRQGPDIGYQYRSAIFYHDDEQKKIALGVKEKLEKEGKYDNPIVTQIAPAAEFYQAEEYHQKYYAKNRTPTLFSKLLKELKGLHD
jgi:peptide-methionine (S)-S-oxide reductase